jgi:hypothetical protein
MPDRMYFRRLLLFLFEDIFSILFYIIFSNFKVLDIILQVIVHILLVKANGPNILEKVSYL